MNPSAVAVFVPIVGIVMVFSFLAVATWSGNRQKEREAFYKSETLRRISEASGEGAKAAIDLMREEERMQRIKHREGLKMGGLVCVAVGVGLTGLLLTLSGAHYGSPYMVGMIPGLIGVALLVYVYKLAAPVE